MTDKRLDYHVSSSAVREFFNGGGEFLPPERLLSDLTAAQAVAVPPGSPYSIACLVAHMRFWQNYNLARVCGETPPRPEHLEDTFPNVQADEWMALVSDFLAGVQTCQRIAAEKGNDPSLARLNTTIGYELAECPGLHSAYHYGQIAMLRQIQGFWPPAGGDDAW